MTSEKAPAVIWARPDYNECWPERGEEEDVKYIRHDLHLAAVAEAYQAAMKAAFRACQSEQAGYRDENERIAQRIENELRLEVSAAIRRLTPADAARAARAAARAAETADAAYAAVSAVQAARAAAHTNCWQKVDPIGVLERMTKIGED